MTAPSALEQQGDTATTPATSHGGDHDVFTHVVKKDGLADAQVFGYEVDALCGKRWVPTRDPKKHPLCGTCKDLVEAITGGPWAPDGT